MMRLVVPLKDIFMDATEKLKGFLEEELLAFYVNISSILQLASDFEDGELVLAMKLLVALPLVGRLL